MEDLQDGQDGSAWDYFPPSFSLFSFVVFLLFRHMGAFPPRFDLRSHFGSIPPFSPREQSSVEALFI